MGAHRFIEQRPVGKWVRALATVLAITIVSIAILLHLRSPLELGVPSCPTHRLLGLYCPGCGSTRASHHLLNGHFVDAWRHNPMLILLGLPALAALLTDLVTTIAVGRRTQIQLGSRTGLVIAVIMVLYMLVRNLPMEALEGLRPPEPTVPRSAEMS